MKLLSTTLILSSALVLAACNAASEPTGQVVATERVTLLGVPIVAGRTVSYGRIDPEESRRLFIQSALVEGQWHTRHHFWARTIVSRQF